MEFLIEDYYKMLNDVEKVLDTLDIEEANRLMSYLFSIKPVRLKWYLIKAKIMLKEGKKIYEVSEFLQDKCIPLYPYEDVDEYLEMQSELAYLQGDNERGLKYKNQLFVMKQYFELACHEVSELVQAEIELNQLRETLLKSVWISGDQIQRLADLYYIKGNQYLYFLWKSIQEKQFLDTYTPVREEVISKENVKYFYERLMEDRQETFVVMINSFQDQRDCILAARGLCMLKHSVFLLEEPSIWKKTKNITDSIDESICGLRKENGISILLPYWIEIGGERMDNRGELLEYISENYGRDGLITVLGAGVLLDELTLHENLKQKMERLTRWENDYQDTCIGVARFGNYLAYTANIFRCSTEEIEEALNRVPSCRFSFIIPCRNTSDTLFYTLKTCLEQSFTGDYEIVVSDNTDQKYGIETNTYRICREFQDERIRYYRTPRDLGISKNFEYAFLKANGEFLIAMGADDGIFPWALEELDQLLEKFPNKDVMAWEDAFYEWRTQDDQNGRKKREAQLTIRAPYIKNSTQVMELDAKELLRQCFKQYSFLYFLPKAYHNCGLRRKYLKKLYDATGALWNGYTQDICTAVVIAGIEKTIFFVKNLFTIDAISSASVGDNVRIGNTDLKQENFWKKYDCTLGYGGKAASYLERFMPITGSIYGGFYTSILYGCAIGIIPEDCLEKMNWNVMYEITLNEIFINDILFDAKFHNIRYAVSRHGKEFLNSFDENSYKKLLKPIILMDTVKQTVKDDQEYIIIEEKNAIGIGKINNVYKASCFVKELYKKE